MGRVVRDIVFNLSLYHIEKVAIGVRVLAFARERERVAPVVVSSS